MMLFIALFHFNSVLVLLRTTCKSQPRHVILDGMNSSGRLGCVIVSLLVPEWQEVGGSNPNLGAIYPICPLPAPVTSYTTFHDDLLHTGRCHQSHTVWFIGCWGFSPLQHLRSYHRLSLLFTPTTSHMFTLKVTLLFTPIIPDLFTTRP